MYYFVQRQNCVLSDFSPRSNHVAIHCAAVYSVNSAHCIRTNTLAWKKYNAL